MHQHLIEVNGVTTNRNNGALQRVGAKAGDLPEMLKYGRQGLNVMLNGNQKHGRIICI
jgi:hypothetical protein